MAFALAMLGNTVLFAHQVAYMIDRGYNSLLAATLAGGLGLVSLPGRFVLNLLSERISPQRLLGLCLIIQTLGIIALILAPSVGWLVVYVILYGAAFGAILPLRASVMADQFGRRAYGAITAIQGISVAICAAGGPVAAGWLYDLLGHYDVAFWLCALGFLLAAGGVLLTPPSPIHQEMSVV
jgi:MFS family permease